MNATEEQAKIFSIIMLTLHPEYARANAEKQKTLTDEVMNLVINEGLRQVMAEIEIMNAYRPKKAGKAKKTTPKFCPACDFRLDQHGDLWECPNCHKTYGND